MLNLSEKVKVLYPETVDKRIQEVVNLLGNDKEIRPLTLNDFDDEGILNLCIDFYLEKMNKRGKNISRQDAVYKLTEDPYSRLYKAAILLSQGYVDICIAGSASPTSEVLKAAIYCIGMKKGIESISSFFIMKKENKLFAFADCGVIKSPNHKQLSDIAISTALNFQKLTGLTPVVGFITHSTFGSSSSESIDKVNYAINDLKLRNPDLLVCEKEIQMDVALNREIGIKKGVNPVFSGKINVFIFPDIDSGNITYKTFQEIGGYHAIGPIIQGLEKPMMDLSRGCKIDDILDLTRIAISFI